MTITPEIFALLTNVQVVSGAHIRSQPPAHWAPWCVVETLLEDESRWCDIEGKWEYAYTENFVLALRSEVAGLQKLIELDGVQEELEGRRPR